MPAPTFVTSQVALVSVADKKKVRSLFERQILAWWVAASCPVVICNTWQMFLRAWIEKPGPIGLVVSDQ